MSQTAHDPRMLDDPQNTIQVYRLLHKVLGGFALALWASFGWTVFASGGDHDKMLVVKLVLAFGVTSFLSMLSLQEAQRIADDVADDHETEGA